MKTLELIWWVLAASVIFTYVIYPLLIGWIARGRSGPRRATGANHSVSIVVAAHNEQPGVARRLRELKKLLEDSGACGQIILVCDGCDDATAAAARSVPDVRVIELESHCGKAAALTGACAVASGDIIVFADVRQSWEEGSLGRLLENFSDTAVGAVSGDLVLQDSRGMLLGVGTYWRLEKWLRRQESRIHSTTGVTGAISAVRRELFCPIPPGTILDDVYWPLRVVMQGFRVIHDERARAYDRLPDHVRDEFRRKVRTLSGNLQLVQLLPQAMLPWRCPIAFQFVSHKLMRLVVPWSLLGMLVLGGVLPGNFYRSVFFLQILFCLLAITSRRSRVGAVAASFLVLNAAAWVAFWVWASGRTERAWKKTAYAPTRPAASDLVENESLTPAI